MKTLFAIGDSLTAGAECIADGDLSEENKHHAYPMYIAKNLNIDECINKALPGASNDWIARRCVQDLEQLKREGRDLKDMFVVVGWTSIGRTEISIRSLQKSYSHDPELNVEFMPQLKSAEMSLFGTLFINGSMTPSKHKGDGELFIETFHEAKNFLGKYMWDLELEYEKWYSNILMLKAYLENNVGNFLFVNNVHQCELVNTAYNFANYYKPDTSFNAWVDENKYQRMKLFHPVEKAHGDYAQLLTNYIKEHYEEFNL